VVARDWSALTARDLSALATLEARVRNLTEVSAVRDQGTSADGEAATALVLTPLSTSSPDAGGLVERIRDEIDRADFGEGVRAALTGTLAEQVDTLNADAEANELTAILTNVVVLVMLFLVYRSVLAPIVTLLPAVVALAVGGPVIAAASQEGWFAVSGVTQALFTVVVIGAGTDYGLFLVLRMREELAAGHDTHDAVVRSVRSVGESIASSAGTVIVALLSLLLATFGLYADLGPALAIAVAIMLTAALTLLPALCAVLGRHLFWPRKITAHGEDGAWGRIAERIVARPKAALAGGGVVLVALALCAFGFTSAGFGGGGGGPAGSGSAEGAELIADHYPAALVDPTPVVMRFDEPVWDDLGAVARAQRELRASSGFSSVTGLTAPAGRPFPVAQLAELHDALGAPHDLAPIPPPGTPVPPQLYEAYRATGQFVSPDGRTVQFLTGLSAGPATSTAALDAIPALRDEVGRVGERVGAEDVGVAGVAAVSYDVSQVSSDDLRRVLPVVLVLIAGLLALVLRSLVAPLYLVVSVVLSYFAALGMAVVLFQWIGGADGLNFVLPFLMFVFLMALGSDYNILVMSRIREEAHDHPLPVAIKRSVHRTGTTVTSAGMVLAATFLVVGFTTPATQVRQLGVAIALGVLLDTFLVRTLLVPSMVALLGRWNWWPSRMGRRPEGPPPAPPGTPEREPVGAGTGR
jgi:RND superfamily putative drug exporter